MLRKIVRTSVVSGFLAVLISIGGSLQAQTSKPASAQLTEVEQKVVEYIMT